PPPVGGSGSSAARVAGLPEVLPCYQMSGPRGGSAPAFPRRRPSRRASRRRRQQRTAFHDRISLAEWGIVVYSGAKWGKPDDPSMLLGEFEHTLDDKNRLTLPARFRESLAEGVVVTRGMDGCLYAYSRADWMERFQSGGG